MFAGDGFRQESVHPCLKRFLLKRILSVGGAAADKGDLLFADNLALLVHLVDAAGNFGPIHPGHAEVEQD